MLKTRFYHKLLILSGVHEHYSDYNCLFKHKSDFKNKLTELTLHIVRSNTYNSNNKRYFKTALINIFIQKLIK